MKKYFLLLVAVAVCGICAAYDFTAVSPSGHTLYYTIDGSNVKVAPEIYNPSSLITEVYETSPVGDLVIPESVNHEGVDYTVSAISAYAFSYCKGLTSVFIPASVTTIENGAFSQCSGIKYLEVPGTVTSIGSGAFAMVRHVEYYGPATDRSNWGTLSLNGVVEGNLAYSDESKTQLNACIDTDENGTVTIPESVKVISRYAFFELPSLVSIAIPNTVDSLGMGVFANCENLVSATLPAKIKLIHGQLFAGCISLKSFVVPDSVEKIYLSAFDGCESLEEVTIGYNTKSIASYAFYDCHSLKTIRTHAPVPPTFFEEDTFDEVPKDQVEVIVPGGCLAAYQAAWNEFSRFKEVWDPKYNVFPYAHNGQTLYYRLKTDTAVNETYAICSYPILFPTTAETLWEGFDKPVGEVEIPSTVAFNGERYPVLDFGRSAFAYCDAITGITIPEGVFKIGNGAMYRCTNLQSVSIPEGVRTIDYLAFGYCDSLRAIVLPESTDSIGEWVFYNCNVLTDVTLLRADVPGAYANTFTTYDIATLHVPAGSAEAYRQHPVWSLFAHIVETTEGIDNPSATNNAAKKIVVNGHLLIVKGEKTYTTTGALVK